MTATEIREKYPLTEVARRAHEIYDRDIKPKVEPQHNGAWLVLNVLTGEYLIDEDEIESAVRGLEKFPDGVRFGFLIGSPATGRI